MALNKDKGKEKVEEEKVEDSDKEENSEFVKSNESYLMPMDRITYQKWNEEITLVIKEDFIVKTITLIDSGADMNCIREVLIPTIYLIKLRKI